MKVPTRHRISVALMLASLALLAAFLLWFLQQVKSDAYNALKREGELLLVNTVRNIEGETFNQLILEKGKVFNTELALPHPTDSLRVMVSANPPDDLSLSGHKPQKGDSIQLITVLNERATVIKKDSPDGNPMREERRMDIRLSPHEQQTTGALSVILSFNHSTQSDTVAAAAVDSSLVFEKLKTGFQEAMNQSGLGLQYDIQRAISEVPDNPSAIATYFDVVSKERYDVFFYGYNTWILRQIWPQILFAVLLFGIVGLSFLLIYQNLRRQERLTELKNDFIRNITHELKTPIATVSVAIEALQNFGALDNPERTREYLSISGSELNRLSLLVDKVLRMSLFEAQEQELKLETVDFRQLIEEILASMRLQFEKYRATVQWTADDSNCTLTGDRLHLASVVYNLIDNALKYSPDRPQINITLKHVDMGLQLTVSDQGLGIPAAYRHKIFEKFFRVPSGDVHNVKGHGLGLSYVAGVVKQHQGHITVDSTEGRGTTFLVYLPMQQDTTKL